jgi:hypothetical protein
MIDHSDAVIVVWDGSEGETANCVSYAQEHKKPILIFDPVIKSEKWKLSN